MVFKKLQCFLTVFDLYSSNLFCRKSKKKSSFVPDWRRGGGLPGGWNISSSGPKLLNDFRQSVTREKVNIEKADNFHISIFSEIFIWSHNYQPNDNTPADNWTSINKLPTLLFSTQVNFNTFKWQVLKRAHSFTQTLLKRYFIFLAFQNTSFTAKNSLLTELSKPFTLSQTIMKAENRTRAKKLLIDESSL